jgi:3-keto-5-aminohexanoate cleavage enzyme
LRLTPETSNPAVITCAVSGGIVTGNPNQPRTREDVVGEALSAAAGGASVVHIHARSTDGRITQSPDDYRVIKQKIREQNQDVVLNFSTGGPLGMPVDERRRSLEAQPDIASLNCGSMNFGPGDDVFVNQRSIIADLASEMDRRGIVREYECFDLGMAVAALGLVEAATERPGVMHLVLGVIGAAPPAADVITTFASWVPEGVPWLATAIGRNNFPIMAISLALGGHARTGLEDVVYVSPHEYATSNGQLVERACTLCRAVGRPVATPAQARTILGIAPSAASSATE